MLARTLSLPLDAAQPNSARKVETQLLHFNGESWNAYAYQWNDEQTDANLVGASGTEETFAIKDAAAPNSQRQQTWRFASRAESALPIPGAARPGFNAPQLDRGNLTPYRDRNPFLNFRPGCARRDRQCSETGADRKLADPHNAEADLMTARSLHVNCSHCHREHAAALCLLHEFRLALENSTLLGRAQQGTFEWTVEVVAASDPYRSVLYYRISKLGKGHMPYLGSRIIDERGAALIHDWITTLPRDQTKNLVALDGLAKHRASDLESTARLGSTLPASDRDAIIDGLLGSASSALGAATHVVTERSLDTET